MPPDQGSVPPRYEINDPKILNYTEAFNLLVMALTENVCHSKYLFGMLLKLHGSSKAHSLVYASRTKHGVLQCRDISFGVVDPPFQLN